MLKNLSFDVGLPPRLLQTASSPEEVGHTVGPHGCKTAQWACQVGGMHQRCSARPPEGALYVWTDGRAIGILRDREGVNDLARLYRVRPPPMT